MFGKRNMADISYGIIGLNTFGKELAINLAQSSKDIMVIDTDEEAVRDLREYTENAFVVRSYDKKTLRDTGIQNCDVVVVCMASHMDTSILTVLHLIGFKIPRVIAQTSSDDQGEVFKKMGAEVVFPEKDMAVRLARRLEPSQIINYIELSEDVDISKMSLPEKLIGKSIIDSQIRGNYGLNIIAIESGGEIIPDFSASYVFQEGDQIIVIGDRDKIKKFENLY